MKALVRDRRLGIPLGCSARSIPSPASRLRVSRPDLLDEVERSGDVGVDDFDHVVEIFVEKAATNASPGISEQRLDQPSARSLRKALSTPSMVARSPRPLGLRRRGCQVFRRSLDLRLVGSHDQVESIFGAAARQLTADAGSSHQAQRPLIRCFSSHDKVHFRGVVELSARGKERLYKA
jgi:hypothetical protein